MVLLATLAVGACSRPAGGRDVANARRELAELVKVYEEASNQGDAHELAALYGEEALLLPPDGGIVAGRDSIMEFWQDGLERGLTLDTVRVVAHERDGYVVGTYHVAPTDETAADSGKYVMCFARGDDGWQPDGGHLERDIVGQPGRQRRRRPAHADHPRGSTRPQATAS